MKKAQFEHTIRVAGAIPGINEVLVIGSQAVHASIDMILPVAERSIEADISAMQDDLFEAAATNGVKSYCLELHDLWISKAIAGRPKASEFCESLLENGLINTETLSQGLVHIQTFDSTSHDSVNLWPGRTE